MTKVSKKKCDCDCGVKVFKYKSGLELDVPGFGDIHRIVLEDGTEVIEATQRGFYLLLPKKLSTKSLMQQYKNRRSKHYEVKMTNEEMKIVLYALKRSRWKAEWIRVKSWFTWAFWRDTCRKLRYGWR